MSLKHRLTRLEAAVGVDGPCDDGPITLLMHYSDEEIPPIPADAQRCLKCGEIHLMRVLIKVVESNHV